MVADVETPPEMVGDPSRCSSTETVETVSACQHQQKLPFSVPGTHAAGCMSNKVVQ